MKNIIEYMTEFFFQNVEHSDESSIDFPYGRYIQLPLEPLKATIGNMSIYNIRECYNNALTRIAEITKRRFVTALLKAKRSKEGINNFISKDIKEIHYYIHRAIEIRNILIELDERKISYEEKERDISSPYILGKFNEILFLKQIFYSIIPDEHKNNKKLRSIFEDIVRMYNECSEAKKVR